MISNTLGGDVMMQLGDFQFSINTAAYQELTRSTEHTWASQARFGKLDALQYTGPGTESITLPGVIFPEYRGGLQQLNDMRAIASDAEPQLMMDGDGNVLGLWVIERVEEKQTVFGGAGAPRRQEFTLALRKFDDVAADLVEAMTEAAGAGAAAAATGDMKTAAGAVGAVKGLAGKLKGLASGAIASLKGALAGVTGLGGMLGGKLASIKGAIGRGISAATGLKNLANGVLGSLKGIPTLGTAKLGLGNIASFATGMLTQTKSAESVMKGALASLGGGLPAAATSILKGATGNLTALSGTARLAGTSAKGLLGLMA